MTSPGDRWTPAPDRPRSRIALLVAPVVVAAAAMILIVWWQSSAQGTSPAPRPTASPSATSGGETPTPRPTASAPGLTGGETFSMKTRTELWVSGVLITAHLGNDNPDESMASYSVSGPTFDTIEVNAAPGTVIVIPGWGQLTAERVRSEPAKKRDLKPGETGAVPPTITLYFRAVTDIPFVVGSRDLPADD